MKWFILFLFIAGIIEKLIEWFPPHMLIIDILSKAEETDDG